jgi:hypothetical protein
MHPPSFGEHSLNLRSNFDLFSVEILRQGLEHVRKSKRLFGRFGVDDESARSLATVYLFPFYFTFFPSAAQKCGEVRYETSERFPPAPGALSLPTGDVVWFTLFDVVFTQTNALAERAYCLISYSTFQLRLKWLVVRDLGLVGHNHPSPSRPLFLPNHPLNRSELLDRASSQHVEDVGGGSGDEE